MKMEQVILLINNAKKIAILPHIMPDGDAIGSSFALKFALEKMGKNAHVIFEDELPKNFKPWAGEYMVYDPAANISFDLVISVDCGDMGRLGQRAELFKGKTLNIDHHKTNTLFASENYIEGEASSTGEIIYNLILNLDVPVDKPIADNLYIAVSTDTGCFKYANTTPDTHIIAAQLIRRDVDLARINKAMFDTISYSRLNLTAYLILNMEFSAGGMIAVSCMDKKTRERYNISEDDVEGLSTLPRSIEGVEVGVFIRETNDGDVKVSMRSNNFVDVSVLAAQFGGGGHRHAGGFNTKGTVEEVKNSLIPKIELVMR